MIQRLLAVGGACRKIRRQTRDRSCWLVLTVLSICCLGDQAQSRCQAEPFYAVSDRFGYTGTVTRYATLSDALSQSNPLTIPIPIPQRDLSIYATNQAGVAGFDPADANSFAFSTAWFLPSPPGTGVGNPNNTTVGFVQINDPTNRTVNTSTAFYTDPSLTSFQLLVSGTDALPRDPVTGVANEEARFWNAPGAAGAAILTQGIFRTYSLDATFSDLNPATLVNGIFESDNPGRPISISGKFRAVFENTNPIDPGSLGFYDITLNLNNVSTAVNNGWLDPPFESTSGLFGSPTVVPEPSSFVLMVLGGLGGATLLGRGQRRDRKRS